MRSTKEQDNLHCSFGKFSVFALGGCKYINKMEHILPLVTRIVVYYCDGIGVRQNKHIYLGEYFHSFLTEKSIGNG